MDAKKALVLVGVALVLFYTITQPALVGDVITTVFGWLRDGADAIIGAGARLFG